MQVHVLANDVHGHSRLARRIRVSRAPVADAAPVDVRQVRLAVAPCGEKRRESAYVTVLLRDPKHPLFAYEPDLVLAFDYWLGESTTPLKLFVNVIIGDRAGYFQVIMGGTQSGRRHRVALPLAAIPYHKGEPRALTPGLPIAGLEIGTDWRTDDVLFVDNVGIYHPRP